MVFRHCNYRKFSRRKPSGRTSTFKANPVGYTNFSTVVNEDIAATHANSIVCCTWSDTSACFLSSNFISYTVFARLFHIGTNSLEYHGAPRAGATVEDIDYASQVSVSGISQPFPCLGISFMRCASLPRSSVSHIGALNLLSAETVSASFHPNRDIFEACPLTRPRRCTYSLNTTVLSSSMPSSGLPSFKWQMRA